MKMSRAAISCLKAMLLVLAAMAVVASLATAQTNVKYGDQKGGSEQSVRQTLDELYAALGRNDVSALDRIYADDYTLINETGELTTKAPRLAAIRSGDMKYESISFEDPAIRVRGDTAVATYRVNYKARSKGQEVGGQSRVTATFVKIKGRWQLLAAQATRISE